MREQLVAWAGDCVVRGIVELGEGRLSDQVNEAEVITFHNVTLQALDDGHELDLDELEVGRDELHVIEVQGRRGDPVRRRRTVEERVTVEVGPFVVTGFVHRPPSTQPLASLQGWARFVPVTDAVVGLREREDREHQDVVLVNRERISKAVPLSALPPYANDPAPALAQGSPG
jgi:hypothetical protein